MRKILMAITIASIAVLMSCSDKEHPVTDNQQLPHILVKKLTDIMVVDIFSPPVASRIYANCTLAMYEALRHGDPKTGSLTVRLNGFQAMPVPEAGKQYDFAIAAITAFCRTADRVTFSGPEIARFQDSMVRAFAGDMDSEMLKRSINFGEAVASVVADRLNRDNYKETRGMDRFEVKTDDKRRWVPTSPDYSEGLEPHWLKMMPMAIPSSDAYRAKPFPEYSEDSTSPFHREMREVYDISKNMTDEYIDIALFWDDNPFVSRHKGHVMFQDKKMTPGGHWLAIVRKACRMRGMDAVSSSRAYALTSVALYDAFISCWHEKYRSVRIRPQTAIQRLIDEQWISYIQTPPFPEYTSGHSTISASAAEVLTDIFGDGFAFTDSSELEYNLPVRSFTSFRQAAEEASVSRIYGGIHFRSGCVNGNILGREIGKAVIEKAGGGGSGR